MEDWSEIRRRVLVEGVSRRQILRETGMHWQTLRKMLKHSESPGYQQGNPIALSANNHKPLLSRGRGLTTMRDLVEAHGRF